MSFFDEDNKVQDKVGMPVENEHESFVEQIKKRKREGIEIPLKENTQGKRNSTYLEYVKLIHNALPELDFDEVDLSTSFLGKSFSAPLIIDSMTGGTDEAFLINKRLGQIAEKYGIGMGLGSQRAGLKSEKLVESYSIAREVAPNAFLIANIGGAQLSEGLSTPDIMKIIKMIDADALAIHLNPLQELIQPEGEPRFKGILNKIAKLANDIEIPIIVKEVGSGISADVAIRLKSSGIQSINIAGSGGTSWAGIEKIRADRQNDDIKSRLGELFWDWGIPTALSILLVSKSVKMPIIASGGLRNGLEIAKCLILGSDLCAMAFPFLRRASESEEELENFTKSILAEIKSTMFLLGAGNIKSLKNTRYILTDKLASVLGNYE
ncbi:MAG: type 2 isopentenyl-diphosphate Delta-isomerase [Nitrosopumilus sp.]|nr:type 2 isopentenyl-diphosphate Delta-isomerase [Nitrosopumilus sp.]